ncbi:hypothetical protein GNF80_17025 [Clostridium perfringens]|nr:hypothetical protein [Clostridium perfringens]
MNYNSKLKIEFFTEPFINEFFKYKYIDNLPLNEKEYLKYLIYKLDEFVNEVIESGNRNDIFYIGNKLLDLWIKYDIPLYEKYFEKLNI